MESLGRTGMPAARPSRSSSSPSCPSCLRCGHLGPRHSSRSDQGQGAASSVIDTLIDLEAGDQGSVWVSDPPGVLHLRLPDQPDRDDVSHHRRHRCTQQVINVTLPRSLEIISSIVFLCLPLITHHNSRLQAFTQV